jgi:hypothetical protein
MPPNICVIAAFVLMITGIPCAAETGVNPRFSGRPPAATLLLQNQPNPASNYTTIYFYLAKNGPTSLKLYTISGKLIGYFIDGFQESGWYSVGFRTDFLAKGEYMYRLTTPSVASVLKMLVSK